MNPSRISYSVSLIVSLVCVTLFFTLYFYVFATPLSMAVAMGGLWGILYISLLLFHKSKKYFVPFILISMTAFLTVLYMYCAINGIETYSPVLMPAYFIFLVLLDPVLTIPAIAYFVLLTILSIKFSSNKHADYPRDRVQILLCTPYVPALIWVYCCIINR